MGKFYIINSPWAFSTIWSLIKGWLDEATVAKIHILGSDYKAQLLQQISPDALPSYLGGTCTCPEGCSMSDAGPWKGKKGTSIKSTKKEGVPAVEGVQGMASLEEATGKLEIGATPVEEKTSGDVVKA